MYVIICSVIRKNGDVSFKKNHDDFDYPLKINLPCFLFFFFLF